MQLLGEEEEPLKLEPDTINIILFVGVNGVGKTTSIGKIAWQLKEQGHKVILGAADTFRAAAADQLKIWGERVGDDVIAHQKAPILLRSCSTPSLRQNPAAATCSSSTPPVVCRTKSTS